MNTVDTQCRLCHSFGFCQKYEQDYANHVDKKGVWQKCMSPIRKCQHAIADFHLDKLQGVDILEVGCGSKRKGEFIKNLVTPHCQWRGMDIKKTDLTTDIGRVENMPFNDEEFDIVIGNQTMEHWDDIPKALSEIYRVMRHPGELYLNVPIYLHGSEYFVTGNLEPVAKMLKEAGFHNIVVETWRKGHEGLGRYFPGESKKHCKKFGMKIEDTTSAYIANFTCDK